MWAASHSLPPPAFQKLRETEAPLWEDVAKRKEIPLSFSTRQGIQCLPGGKGHQHYSFPEALTVGSKFLESVAKKLLPSFPQPSTQQGEALTEAWQSRDTRAPITFASANCGGSMLEETNQEVQKLLPLPSTLLLGISHPLPSSGSEIVPRGNNADHRSRELWISSQRNWTYLKQSVGGSSLRVFSKTLEVLVAGSSLRTTN